MGSPRLPPGRGRGHRKLLMARAVQPAAAPWGPGSLPRLEARAPRVFSRDSQGWVCKAEINRPGWPETLCAGRGQRPPGGSLALGKGSLGTPSPPDRRHGPQPLYPHTCPWNVEAPGLHPRTFTCSPDPPASSHSPKNFGVQNPKLSENQAPCPPPTHHHHGPVPGPQPERHQVFVGGA